MNTNGRKESKEVLLTIQALQRMPYYLRCLEKAREKGIRTISATSIAAELRLNDVLVRKDIAAVCSTKGKPKAGFPVDSLILDIKAYMGCNDRKEAVIVGAGSLGRALMRNRECEQYGLTIAAGFDIKPELIGTDIDGIPVFSDDEMESFCISRGVKIGIITTDVEAAQEVADRLIASGIRAIWNFAIVKLDVPDGVMVRDEILASSLAMLSHHISSENQ